MSSSDESDIPRSTTFLPKQLRKRKSVVLTEKAKESQSVSLSASQGIVQDEVAQLDESTTSTGLHHCSRSSRPSQRKSMRTRSSCNSHSSRPPIDETTSCPSTSKEDSSGTSSPYSATPRKDSSDENLMEKWRGGARKQLNLVKKSNVKYFLKTTSPVLDDFRKKKKEDNLFRQSLSRPSEGIKVFPDDKSKLKEEYETGAEYSAENFHGFDEAYDNIYRNVLPSISWSQEDCGKATRKRKSRGASSSTKKSVKKYARSFDKEHPFAFPDELIGPFNEIFSDDDIPHVHDKEIDEYLEAMARKNKLDNFGSSKEGTSETLPDDYLLTVGEVSYSDSESCVQLKSCKKISKKQKEPANKNIKVPYKKSRSDSLTADTEVLYTSTTTVHSCDIKSPGSKSDSPDLSSKQNKSAIKCAEKDMDEGINTEEVINPNICEFNKNECYSEVPGHHILRVVLNRFPVDISSGTVKLDDGEEKNNADCFSREK